MPISIGLPGKQRQEEFRAFRLPQNLIRGFSGIPDARIIINENSEKLSGHDNSLYNFIRAVESVSATLSRLNENFWEIES